MALTPSRRREAQIESWLGRRWAEMQNIDSQRNAVGAQLGKVERELGVARRRWASPGSTELSQGPRDGLAEVGTPGAGNGWSLIVRKIDHQPLYYMRMLLYPSVA